MSRVPLIALLVAASLVMASTTCVTAVIPQIAADLGATQTGVQWIGDAYPLTLASLLLPAGALLDRVGRRRGLMAGLLLLTISLAWSAAASSTGSLVASRVLAGVGGALVFPATLASLSAGLEDARRTRAVAMWAGAVMAGGGYGLVLGGAMAQAASWNVAFWCMAALAAITLLLAVRVPETRDPEHAHLDPVGALLSLVATGALTGAIIESPVRGVFDGLVLAGFAIGIAAGGAFIAWELRIPHPLLDVRLLTDRVFGSAAVAIFTMFGAAFGWFFVAFQFYAYAFGWSPLHSSLGLLPNIVPLVLLVPVGIKLERHIGRRRTTVTALLVMAGGAVLTALAGRADSPFAVMAGFALIGAGGGLGQGPATQAIVDALPRAQQGVASAVNDVSRELGAAVGIAIVGSAFTAGYRAETHTPPSATPAGLLNDAVVHGWTAGMAAAAAMLLLGAIFVGVRLRSDGSGSGSRSPRAR